MGKVAFPNMTVTGGNRVDWKDVRDTIDLAAVVTGILGPAPGRRGERGRKLWWPCPFHEDQNPSFAVDPGKPWYRCYGCEAHGDAATFVMQLNGLSFPQAVEYLTGGASAGTILPRKAGAPRPSARRPPAPPRPSALDEGTALATLEAAERRLWEAEGSDDLSYLRGRGLADETIRSARLGTTPPLTLPGSPRGVVLSWWEHGKLTLVKIRQPDGRRPKYYELFRRAPGIFHGNGPVMFGRPLVIVEGEFDALLLGQELTGLATVVSLGSASARPTSQTLGPMLGAHPWYIATDNDPAGDKAADGWPAGTARVRPPGNLKDWTEVRQWGVNLRRWWVEVLAKAKQPPLFTWEEVRSLRWDPATEDDEPGLIVDSHDPVRLAAALAAADRNDPYAIAEREAIQAEGSVLDGR